MLRDGLPFAAQFQQQPDGRPTEAGSLGRHEESVGAPAVREPVDEIEWHGAHRRKPGDGLLVLSCFAKLWISPSFRRPDSLSRATSRSASSKLRAAGNSCSMSWAIPASNLRIRPACRARRRRAAAREPLGRPQQQVAEELQRHVETPAELLDQAFIALGPPRQRRIAGVGERGARVAGQCVHHVAIAAIHQHIGDLLLDRRAAGDREQVRLAFLLRDADKIGGRQPGRLRQHRACDRDLIVMGETLDNVVGACAIGASRLASSRAPWFRPAR